MRIKSLEKDFIAIYECEHCKKELKAWGYCDEFFRDKVIPGAICPNCHRNSKGEFEEAINNYHRYYLEPAR